MFRFECILFRNICSISIGCVPINNIIADCLCFLSNLKIVTENYSRLYELNIYAGLSTSLRYIFSNTLLFVPYVQLLNYEM